MKYEQELIALIKEKPELASLDDSYVQDVLKTNFASVSNSVFDKYTSFDQCKRGKKCKELVTNVRKYLRIVYGLFVIQPLEDFQKTINSLKSYESDATDKMLLAHQSTTERFASYNQLYVDLFEKLHEKGLSKEFTLADFACGCNPFAYKYLPTKPKHYTAVDLSSKDMEIVQTFFDNTNISGEAKSFDVSSTNFESWIEKKHFDVIFLFKALDSFEAVKRHTSKKILSKLDADFLVVSFPLVSIGGKQSIAASKRWWFENFCTQNSWEFEVFSAGNEQFFIVSMHKGKK